MVDVVGIEPTMGTRPDWFTASCHTITAAHPLVARLGIEPRIFCFRDRDVTNYTIQHLAAEVGVEPTPSCFKDR